MRDALKAAAPDGIDVYFDNVGGEHLEAAIGALKLHGRAAICGMISQYNATEPPAAPRNLALVIGKRLTLRGFLVGDHGGLREQFVAEVGRLAARGPALLRRDDRRRHRATPPTRSSACCAARTSARCSSACSATPQPPVPAPAPRWQR